MERREGIVSLNGPGQRRRRAAGVAHREVARPQRTPGPRAGHGRAQARRRRLEAGLPPGPRRQRRAALARSLPPPAGHPLAGQRAGVSTGSTGDRSGVHRVDNLPPGIPVQLPARRPGRGSTCPTSRCRRRGRQRHRLPDPGPGLEPDDRPLLAPGLPGRPFEPAAAADQLLGLPAATAAAASWSPTPTRCGKMAGRAGRDVPQEAADPRDVPRRPVRLVPPAAGRETTTGRWPRATPRRSTAATSSDGPACGRHTRTGVRWTSTPGRTRTARARARSPNTWWLGHSHPRVAWRSRSHAVVRVMASARAALDLRQRRHPALRRAGRQRPGDHAARRACGTDVCH